MRHPDWPRLLTPPCCPCSVRLQRVEHRAAKQLAPAPSGPLTRCCPFVPSRFALLCFCSAHLYAIFTISLRPSPFTTSPALSVAPFHSLLTSAHSFASTSTICPSFRSNTRLSLAPCPRRDVAHIPLRRPWLNWITRPNLTTLPPLALRPRSFRCCPTDLDDHLKETHGRG